MLASPGREPRDVPRRGDAIFAAVEKMKLHGPFTVNGDLLNAENNFLFLQVSNCQCQRRSSAAITDRLRLPADENRLPNGRGFDFQSAAPIGLPLLRVRE